MYGLCKSAVLDTISFFLGFLMGLTIDYLLAAIIVYLDNMTPSRLGTIAVVQILINALIIRFFHAYIIDRGLFATGLFTSQLLYTRTLPNLFRKRNQSINMN